MKKLLSFAVCLVIFSTVSFAKARTNDKCTLEQTTDFNATVALATAEQAPVSDGAPATSRKVLT